MPDVRPRARAAPPVGEPPPDPPPARRRARKGWWMLLGGVALATLVGGLFVAYRVTTEATVPAPSVPSLAIPAAPVAPVAASGPATPSPVLTSRAVVASAAPPAPATAVPRPSLSVRPNSSRTNLALTGTVTASSSEGRPYPASKAVDGDASTRWSSGFAEPQWLRLDLRERRKLTEVTLIWEHAHAVAYRVDVSLDGRTWKPIFSTTAGRGGTVAVDAGGAVARFVRMYGTKRSNQYGFSLFEFQVR